MKMSTEKLHTEIRQEQIAQAALNLVSSQGLKRLSVADVARRVGIVPSGLYRHFHNKEEILDSVLDLIRNMLQANVRTACQEASNPLEQLRRLLNYHIRMIRENQGIPRIIFSQDVYSGYPERQAKVYGAIQEYLHQVRDIVRRGQKKGEIKMDLDPETVSLIFLGMIQPAAILWHLSDGAFDVTKHGEKAWRIFSQAIQSS
jgi:AcrR family transcriptional regulator